jgi:hypothetical protein
MNAPPMELRSLEVINRMRREVSHDDLVRKRDVANAVYMQLISEYPHMHKHIWIMRACALVGLAGCMSLLASPLNGAFMEIVCVFAIGSNIWSAWRHYWPAERENEKFMRHLKHMPLVTRELTILIAQYEFAEELENANV